ncbi:MAG TPA: NAD(P)/FAD-dependent oxidoreductase [Thermoleophilaceae bacterium]|nr:NAD(P)/FAD-dependent oxidoreductase [Thermoleophilaceae bacterium]
MRVAVVGAGLAGLAAADELHRAGATVTVLEARERVGGRVYSRTLENGAIIEMGAEYLLPGNTAIRELVERFDLGLWDKGMRYGHRDPRGGLGTDHAELERAAAAIGAALPEVAESISARAFLDGLDIPAGAREALIARVEISSANSADVVAARDLAGLAHVDRDPAPSIAGGNQRLAFALAEPLGEAVRLRSPVEAIRWEDSRVSVSAADGELEADACVVAVPARVLDGIAFEPALPEPLATALTTVRYGHAAKLFVPLRSPAATSAVMNVPERYWTWTSTGTGGVVQPVVSAFAGSRAALERLRLADGPGSWVASLTRLRGDLELDPAGTVLSTWSDDPWARAAYSTSPSTELAELCARPVGALVFAGEHAGGEFAALMEGAIRSGVRAARALLAVHPA